MVFFHFQVRATGSCVPSHSTLFHLLISMFEIVWICFTCTCLLIYVFSPYIGFLSTHGKMAPNSPKANHSLHSSHQKGDIIQRWLSTFSQLTVKKGYFGHFYVLGTIISLYCLSYEFLHASIPFFSNSKLQVLFLFSIQCIRRGLECSLASFGQSKLHISAYIVGLLHYLFIPIAILNFPSQNCSPSRSLMAWAVFFLGSYVQTCAHESLRQLKLQQLSTGRYSVPKNFPFFYICCPHYTAEICIYAALTSYYPFNNEMVLVFLWVVSNLSVVADEQLRWYWNKFKEDIPNPNWKRLIPFVW